jgi:BirA family biotin operon repressor/biotin-[acetyl-CoA-carboxylase] ligase
MPKVLRFPVVGSTMDLLHQLAAKGAEAGTVVVAGEQTTGRGSRGRVWRSPPGGLWLSALYRPGVTAGVELFSLRVGLAVAEAIEALGPGLRVAIKWPNDLILDDRKLGGILCEARWQGEALAWVVAGVGVNVTNAAAPELAAGAIRLADRLPGAEPEALEPEVTARLRTLDPSGDRLDPLELAALRDRDWLRTRRLQAPVAGRAEGIADDGALLVRDASGAIQRVRAGTVALAEPSLTP